MVVVVVLVGVVVVVAVVVVVVGMVVVVLVLVTGWLHVTLSDKRVTMYVFIYLLKAYLQPSQPHRVTSGLFNNSSLTEVEYNTKHAHLTHVKHINIIRMVVPSVLL